ncbi:transposase [Vibrio superstes]|uniref:transposase n=1 Tax=Vibrio superstes TaxID=198815 RepID=UPI001F2ED64F|nr:transposase [Vibrio superstes]
MTTARKQLVAVEATPYYHCVSRCVRQSFRCGTEKKTNISYEHRRDWIEQKLKDLALAYCIDICAYAIMSNHYHLILHINMNKAVKLPLQEVVRRWGLNHSLPELIKRWKNNELTSAAEEMRCIELIESWRNRLWNLSWFMKELNYDIACRANQEDNCKGHFWESRFKSQALLDEKALIAAMAYVDLNPIRSGIADTPEQSEHTSVRARLHAFKQNIITPSHLCPLIGNSNKKSSEYLPIKLLDYLCLIDWTARQFRKDKASMDDSLPPILERLNFTQQRWFRVCTMLESSTATAIGRPVSTQTIKHHLGKTKIHIYSLD